MLIKILLDDNMKKLNFALIGTGCIAHVHAKSIKEAKHTESTAIRSRNIERIRLEGGKKIKGGDNEN